MGWNLYLYSSCPTFGTDNEPDRCTGVACWYSPAALQQGLVRKVPHVKVTRDLPKSMVAESSGLISVDVKCPITGHARILQDVDSRRSEGCVPIWGPEAAIQNPSRRTLYCLCFQSEHLYCIVGPTRVLIPRPMLGGLRVGTLAVLISTPTPVRSLRTAVGNSRQLSPTSIVLLEEDGNTSFHKLMAMYSERKPPVATRQLIKQPTDPRIVSKAGSDQQITQKYAWKEQCNELGYAFSRSRTGARSNAQDTQKFRSCPHSAETHNSML